MSGLGLDNLQPIGVLDPRLEPFGHLYPVLKTGKKITQRSYVANSIDTSGISWSIVPPSPNTWVSRMIMVEVPFRLKLTSATLVGAAILLPQQCAIRSNPIQKGLLNLQMSLNGDTVDMPIGDVISATEHYQISYQMKEIDNSLSASYGACHCQNFADLYQKNLSPLNTADSDIYGAVPHQYPFTVPVAQDGTGNAAISYLDCVSRERLFLSPLHAGRISDDSHAFYGVKNIDITLSFYNNVGHRFVAIDNTTSQKSTSLTIQTAFTNLTAGDFAAGGAWSYPNSAEPKLLLTYITPQDNDFNAREDKVLSFPYYKTVVYRKLHSAALAASATATVNSDNVITGSYPSRIGVWGRQANSVLTGVLGAFQTDSFFAMNSLVATIGNDPGIFSNAVQAQLYQIAVKNGCTLPWWEWSGIKQNKNTGTTSFGVVANQFSGTGSVLMFDGSDYGMDLLSAPGKAENTMISVQTSLTNVASDSRTPELYTMVVSQGLYQMLEGVVYRKVGVLSSANVAFARNQRPDQMLNYNDVKAQFGGNFLTGLKESLSRAAKHAHREPAVSAGAMVDRVPLSQRAM